MFRRKTMRPYFTYRTSFLIFILVALTLTAYSFGVTDTFRTLDDFGSIVENESIKDFRRMGEIFKASFFRGGFYYRPLVSSSFMIEHHLFGLNPFYYYLDNIFIHILSALCLWKILTLLLPRQQSRPFQGNSSEAGLVGMSPSGQHDVMEIEEPTRRAPRQRRLAFAVALSFAVHPIHWEAVSNISGRAILLCAFFVLNAFLWFLLAQEKDKRLILLSYAGFILALLSKESAVVFPGVLLVYLFLSTEKNERSWRRLAGPVFPYVLILGGYAAVRHALEITRLFYWNSLRESALAFLTFLRSVLTDVRLMVFPVDFQFDRARKMFLSFADPQAVFTLVAVSFGLWILWKFRRRLSPMAKFFLFWFVLEFLPVSQFLVPIVIQPGHLSVAEHFLYMPSVGFLALAGLGLKSVHDNFFPRYRLSRRVFWFSIAGFYAFFFLTTIQANLYAHNEIGMFERTLAMNPDNNRVRNSLAHAYSKLNKFPEAEEHFRKAIAVFPEDVRAMIGLGKSLCDQGRFLEGFRVYERILDAGSVQQTLNSHRRATAGILRRKYQDSLRTNPRDAELLYSLGVMNAYLGDFEAAQQNFIDAIREKPGHANALFNLGTIYASQNKNNEAVALFEKVVKLTNPDEELHRDASQAMQKLQERVSEESR